MNNIEGKEINDLIRNTSYFPSILCRISPINVLNDVLSFFHLIYSSRADENRVITLLSVDAGYIDMALNILETSLLKLGISLCCLYIGVGGGPLSQGWGGHTQMVTHTLVTHRLVTSPGHTHLPPPTPPL